MTTASDARGPAAPAMLVQRSDRLGFRPAIDGVRALAVLAVVGVHFKKSLFSGGGSGVTVFFVLSGFLITTILLEEAASTGRIDVKSFYIRRAYRLLPPLVVMLVVFVCAGIVVYGSDALPSLLSYSAGALSYVNNWLLFNGAPTMLGHTWSLSVEEQFYVFWPMLLVVGIRYLRSFRTLVTLTILVAVASAAWQQWLFATTATTTTFSLTRHPMGGTDAVVFNMLAGAALAQLRFCGAITINDANRTRWRVAGVVALVVWVAVLLPNTAGGDPVWLGSWATLIWCAIGVVLVFVAAEADGGFVVALCVLPVMRWLGKLSYGIYLWHVPAIGLVRDGLPQLTELEQIVVASVITIGGAAASYYTIEARFRELKKRYERRLA